VEGLSIVQELVLVLSSSSEYKLFYMDDPQDTGCLSEMNYVRTGSSPKNFKILIQEDKKKGKKGIYYGGSHLD